MSECNFAEQDLRKAVEGDLQAFEKLKKQSHHQLLTYKERLNKLTLKPDAVSLVLKKLKEGKVAPTVVQEWASFVRRGYVANTDLSAIKTKPSAIQAIAIEYDPYHEHEIVDAIARLDEIGNIVDGEVTNNEIDLMLMNLD